MIFDRNEFREFEEAVFSGGISGIALPMSFIHKGEKTEVIYECSGYVPVSAMEKLSVMECLEITEKVMDLIVRTDDFLIDAGRLRLIPETVFCGRKREVMAAWVPCSKRPIEEVLSGFLTEMERCSEEEAAVYLEKIENDMRSYGMGPGDTAAYCRKLRKEAYEYGME